MKLQIINLQKRLKQVGQQIKVELRQVSKLSSQLFGYLGSNPSIPYPTLSI